MHVVLRARRRSRVRKVTKRETSLFKNVGTHRRMLTLPETPPEESPLCEQRIYASAASIARVLYECEYVVCVCVGWAHTVTP